MSLDRELERAWESLGETRRTFKTGCHGFLYKDKDDDMVRRMSAAAIQRYNYTSIHLISIRSPRHPNSIGAQGWRFSRHATRRAKQSFMVI